MNRPVSTLKALADRNRLRIVAALDGAGELCACQITGLLAVTGATASRHLALLERAGLVERRRDGRWVWYRLDDSARQGPLLAWIRDALAADPQRASDQASLAQILSIDPADYCRLQRDTTTSIRQPTETPR